MYNDIQDRYHDLMRAKGEVINPSDDSLLSASDDTDGDGDRLRKARYASKLRIVDIKASGPLPSDVRDVDEVTEWMDEQGYQRKAMAYLASMEERAREVEGYH